MKASKYSTFYMDVAQRVAALSDGVRLKVGAVIVNNNTMVYGFNGMPHGDPNNCEDRVEVDDGETVSNTDCVVEETDSNGVTKKYRLVTKPEVIHAEINAIAKMATSTLNANGAVMYLTHSPCIECAKVILQAGIKHVYFKDHYRSSAGQQFLLNRGVSCVQFDT